MSKDFSPPRPDSRPAIYAYEDTNPQYASLLKVGYTTVDAQTRVAQQYPTLRPGKPPYRIVLEVTFPLFFVFHRAGFHATRFSLC